MDLTDIIYTWFRQHLATGPLARDTDAYNQAYAAIPALISSANDAVAAAGAQPVQTTRKTNTPPDPAAGDQG